MSSFGAACHTGDPSASFHLAVSASELDRISADHIALLPEVRQGYICILVGREFESAQIYPGPSSHLLIHSQAGLSAHMPYGVLGALAAVQIRRIRYVHRILAPFFKLGLPHCPGTPLAAARGLERGACPERLVGKSVAALIVGKSSLLAAPLPAAAEFPLEPGLGAPFAFEARVVVAYHLLCLYVPFARHYQVRSGPFQHRSEKVQHKGLGEHILYSPVERRSLPLPLVLIGVIVVAVALP